jgi:thiol-disulfide isomerase/thioredoxin
LDRALSPILPVPPRCLPLAAALLYAALGAFANPAAAGGLGPEERLALDAFRQGDMRKLVVLAEPVPAPDVAFLAPDGAPTTLAETNGRLRVDNFWATWCAPCRREMPALDALARERGGDDLAVLAIATGRNAPEAIAAFREEAGIATLATYTDPKSELARAMGVPGLPVTVILDRDGDEIARLLGDADWNAPEARALIDYLAGLSGR